MKQFKKLHTHLKQHHKKYLFGTFGSFAIIKTVLLFIGLFGLIHLADIFAIGTATNVSITGASFVGQTLTGMYTYVDVPWEAVGTTGFSSGQADYISFALDGSGTPYVAYRDLTNTNKSTVMKFNGTGREAVGSPGFSDSGAKFTSLAIDGTGTPYIAYQDSAYSSKATVKRFNGIERKNVDTPGFSDADVYYISLFIDNGTPYIAYSDWFDNGQATVKKFNGTSWQGVGAPRFSTGAVNYTSLFVYSGTPYIAYSDSADSYKATVMKFNSKAEWEIIGIPGFSSGGVNAISLALDGSGTPYVAYNDGANLNKATVMKFNGSGREAVGSLGFSSKDANYISLAINGSGTPYVAYSDVSNDKKATVMKFNGTDREAVGSPGFSAGGVFESIPLAINGSGTLYVAYNDDSISNKVTVMNYLPELEGTSTYQRYRNNVAIAGATGITHTLTTADADTTLKFEVTPITSGGRIGAPLSSTLYIPAPSASAVSFTGIFNVSEILTGIYTYTDNSSGLDDPEGTSRYQRYRNDIAITGATGITYRVTTGDAGMTLKFEVTPISITEVQGIPVQSNGVIMNSLPVVSEITITGIPNTGEILTGNYTYSDSDIHWGAVGTPRFSSGQADYTSLFVYSGTPYISYTDSVNSYKATVMKFNGTAWEVVGSPGFSDDEADYTSLFVYSGTPYIAYMDYANSYKATVMKFNGTSREAVGISGFSDNEADYTSLFVDSGIIYVAYSDYSDAGQATVMKFNGTAWEAVGSPRFSSGQANNISLFVNSGTPYIAYSDYSDIGQTTVMKFNGSDREVVGAPRFSNNEANSISLFIDSGTPYVAYTDLLDAMLGVGQATVMKFNGTTWEAVSSPEFSLGNVNNTSLFVYSGTPYIAYSDASNDKKATVMKFNGTAWEAVGYPSFSDGQANFLSLFVDNGTPYIAYSDYSDIGQATVMKAVLSDFEGASTYQWYRNDIAILGATGITYTLAAGDAGTTIKFEVIPVALSGSSPGIAVQSTGLLINGGQGGGGDTGGGGGGILPKDVCTPDRDCSSSYYDHLCGPCSSTGEVNDTENSCTAYSDELNSAYTFAYENGITTIKNCISADLQGSLIRSHMAKMISQFAIKVLKMKPDTKKTSCTFSDMENESKEMQFYATIACQLGLMGLDTDGVTPKASFGPHDTVDRAQFGTILSRILRGTKYAGELPFYVKHLNALKKNAIMNDITRPLAPEMRGRVMLMLQRSAEKK